MEKEIDYFEWKKSFDEIGETEKGKECFELFIKISNSIDWIEDYFQRLLLDYPDLTVNSNLQAFDYSHFDNWKGYTLLNKIDNILQPFRQFSIPIQQILFGRLLIDRVFHRPTGTGIGELVGLISFEYDEISCRLTNDPPPPTANQTTAGIELKHFSESFKTITDWEEIKAQLIERKFLNQSGKWIVSKAGNKTKLASLIKWMAANGYCVKTKFSPQEIENFCITDFDLEIGRSTIMAAEIKKPEMIKIPAKI